MTRVDKYSDENSTNQDETVVLSRVSRHQNMYDEIYMNSSLVDINNILPTVEETMEEKEEPNTYVEDSYEEKSYSVNDYLSKAHEKNSPDNAKRDINNNEFKEQEDEIRRLIDSINEKEKEEDFFKDLKGEDEDTLIGAKLKTDEFNDIIYENLKMDNLIEGNTILEHALGDNTVLNLEKEEDQKLDHTFEEILKTDNKIRRKSKLLPFIIFCITLSILIIVIVVILLFH